MGKLIGYIRVSTALQNEARQVAEMENQGVLKENIYMDKVSGKSEEGRPAFMKMVKEAEEGDTIIFHGISRGHRNQREAEDFVNEMISRGIKVRFIAEGMFIDGKMKPMDKLTFAIFGGLAEYQREQILEATREGVAIAKAKGLYKGGKQILSMEAVVKIKEEIALGVPKTVIARRLKVHIQTLYLALRRFDKGLCRNADDKQVRKAVLQTGCAEKDFVKYLRRKQLFDLERSQEISRELTEIAKPTESKIMRWLGDNAGLSVRHAGNAAKAFMEMRKRWES